MTRETNQSTRIRRKCARALPNLDTAAQAPAGRRQAAGGFRGTDAPDFITAPGSWLRRDLAVWSRQARFAMMVW